MSRLNSVFSIAYGLINMPNPGRVEYLGGTWGAPRDAQVTPWSNYLPPASGAPETDEGPNVAPPPGPPELGNSPRPASYSAVDAVLSWANPPPSIVPQYATPHIPAAVPDVQTDPPPLNYPTHGLMDLSGDAGLVMAPKPDITIGARPTLAAVGVEEFDAAPLEPYNYPLPEFPAFANSALVDPQRLDYTADRNLIARLKRSLAGNDVLTLAIQEAIYTEQTRGIEREQLREVEKAFEEHAARGFTMPAGAVNAKAALVAEAAREKRNAASKKVRDETWERAFNTLVEATATSIAHEAKRFEIHMAYAKALLESLEVNVRMAAELFDALVRLFNMKYDLVRAVARGYRDYLRAVEAQDSAVVATVRAALGKVRTYQAEVKMYGAQVGTAAVIADIESEDVKQQVLRITEYEAYLTGAMANIGIVKDNLEGFRTAIGAFTKSLSTELNKTDAYMDVVAAYGSVPGVWEANVSAYAGFWRAEGDRAGAYSTFVQESGRKLDAEAAEFREYTNAHRSFLQAQLALVREQGGVAESYARAARTGASVVAAHNRVSVAEAEAVNMQNLARAADDMNDEAMQSADDAFEARMEANRVATNATIAAGLAAAAWGVVSAGVRVGGSAGVSEGAKKSESKSVEKTARRSFSQDTNYRATR